MLLSLPWLLAEELMDELDLPPDRANLFEIIDADASGTLQITEALAEFD